MSDHDKGQWIAEAALRFAVAPFDTSNGVPGSKDFVQWAESLHAALVARGHLPAAEQEQAKREAAPELEPLPCPNCGRPAREWELSAHYVGCTERPGCGRRVKAGMTASGNIEAWNRYCIEQRAKEGK